MEVGKVQSDNDVLLKKKKITDTCTQKRVLKLFAPYFQNIISSIKKLKEKEKKYLKIMFVSIK